jgi:acyl-CoA thioesterase I
MKIYLLIVYALILSPLQAKTILFIGDSLTAGYGLDDENKSYVKLIESELKKKGKEVKVLNGSVSGSTTATGLKRLQWYKKAKADILVLALGANDGLRGLKIENTKKQLANIIDEAKKLDMEVLLAGMLMPPNYGPEYTKQFKNIFTELALEKKVRFIPFLLEGVAGVKELNQADGIHPNEKAQEILKNTVMAQLEPML